MSKLESDISLVIITANALRHKFVTNQLIKDFQVKGVISEIKRPLRQGDTVEENEIIAKHSRERDEKEIEYFGAEKDFNLPTEKIMRVDYEEANSQKVYDWIKKLNPNYVVLFGSGIVRDPLLSEYKGRIINMHLGLSPYYRGSATTFWPFVEKEPECIGVTVHLAVLKVDAGSILGQSRPEINPDDGAHDIGYRNIIAGAELLTRCIREYSAGKIQPKPQRLDIGKVFKHKDFNAQSVLKMKENFSNGMIELYLENKPQRDAQYPIIEA
ncbi:MAG: hypothetical protein HYT03_01130 [Candidatus Harrisonbacteria bacterium]|nr:hypothetical protein [Candidatus Harrisonbacteria bacterium]